MTVGFRLLCRDWLHQTQRRSNTRANTIRFTFETATIVNRQLGRERRIGSRSIILASLLFKAIESDAFLFFVSFRLRNRISHEAMPRRIVTCTWNSHGRFIAFKNTLHPRKEKKCYNNNYVEYSAQNSLESNHCEWKRAWEENQEKDCEHSSVSIMLWFFFRTRWSRNRKKSICMRVFSLAMALLIKFFNVPCQIILMYPTHKMIF